MPTKSTYAEHALQSELDPRDLKIKLFDNLPHTLDERGVKSIFKKCSLIIYRVFP